MIDLGKIITVTEASHDFSKATRIADIHEEAFVFNDNRPKYKIVNLELEPDLELTDDEKLDIVAKRIMDRYRPAFLDQTTSFPATAVAGKHNNTTGRIT